MATWHVSGAKQSFNKGVNGWSLLGGCLWPLKIDKRTFPTPDNGRPPERLQQPPKSIKCNLLRPPATIEFEKKYQNQFSFKSHKKILTTTFACKTILINM